MPVDVAGVDGCKAGWIAVIARSRRTTRRRRIFASFSALVDALPDDAVDRGRHADRPAGLFRHGGRGPEAWCGRCSAQRQSSVFSIPSRARVYADDADFTHRRSLV